MSKTHRSDGPLIAGFHHSGDRGLGVRGGDIPGTGAHGPAIPYQSLSFPTHNETEVMIRILTVPAALTYFTVDENGRVAAEGPPGAHVGTFQLWLDVVDNGTSTYSVLIGLSGLLSGAALLGPVQNSGGLAGALAASGMLTGNAIIGTLQSSGTLAGMPSSGALGGNALVGPVVNGGYFEGARPMVAPLTGRAYATALAYLERFGVEEAAQLLADEERYLTAQVLRSVIVDPYDLNGSRNDRLTAAGQAAVRRLERHLVVTSNFMDGYLRSVATLPLAANDSNAGTLEECCLALTRFGIADDADNATERMDEGAKVWRAWLKDVARGTVQLVGGGGAAAPSRGRTRVGQTKGGIDFGGFGKVR